MFDWLTNGESQNFHCLQWSHDIVVRGASTIGVCFIATIFYNTNRQPYDHDYFNNEYPNCRFLFLHALPPARTMRGGRVHKVAPSCMLRRAGRDTKSVVRGLPRAMFVFVLARSKREGGQVYDGKGGIDRKGKRVKFRSVSTMPLLQY